MGLSKKEIKKMILEERKLNIGPDTFGHNIYISLTKNPCYLRCKFLKHMRYFQYYSSRYEKKKSDLLALIKLLYHSRRANKYGSILNYEICGTNIGAGLVLFHGGPIVIHKKAIIGKNVKFHGDNCVGNNGITDECPIIGDGVDIGVGAKIIGNITIASGIKIGAGSVVVSSFIEEGAVIAGVPAKKIR